MDTQEIVQKWSDLFFLDGITDETKRVKTAVGMELAQKLLLEDEKFVKSDVGIYIFPIIRYIINKSIDSHITDIIDDSFTFNKNNLKILIDYIDNYERLCDCNEEVKKLTIKCYDADTLMMKTIGNLFIAEQNIIINDNKNI